MARGSTSALSIELADGRVLDVVTPSNASGRPTTVHPIGAIRYREFESCPICGAQATQREHVPPQSVGGRTMTLTCGACNNGLATNVEADLADWHNHTISHPTFSGDAVSGGRRSSRILYRTTPDGEFVLLIDGRMDPAVIDLLRSGRVDLAGLLPDNNRVHIALLKHAFLAACLRHGRLEGDAADAVRRDLIAARDAPHPTAVPRSDLAMGLTVLRSDTGPLVDWPVVHAVAELDDDVVEGVILAGSTFVSWSSDPARGRSLVQHGWQHSLSVGEPLDGTVVSVED